MKNNRLIEQPHQKRGKQGLPAALHGRTPEAAKVKNYFGVAVRYHLKTRGLVAEVLAAVPKALDDIPQLFRRFKFWGRHGGKIIFDQDFRAGGKGARSPRKFPAFAGVFRVGPTPAYFLNGLHDSTTLTSSPQITNQ